LRRRRRPPGTELASAAHRAAEGIDEQLAAKQPAMLGAIERQASQDHYGDRVGHPAAQPGRRSSVLDRAHRQRVVADHPPIATHDIGGRRAGRRRGPG
jgi:hypothetical protein